MSFTNEDRKLLTQVHTRLNEMVIPAVRSHGKRLDKIERRYFVSVGAFSVVTGAISAFMTWIGLK